MASTTALDIWRGAPSQRLSWWPQVFLFAFILALAVVDIIWLYVSGVKFVFGGTKLTIPLGLFFAAIGAVYATLRPAPRIASASLSIAQIALFSIPGCVFSYAVMTIGRPLFDPTLAVADAKLGFDWAGYVAFMYGHVWLRTILHWGYASNFYQIMFLAYTLPLCGRYASVNGLLANLIIGGVISCTIGALYPALGAYHYFNIPDRGVSGFIPAIEMCRTGGLSEIDMDHAEGLVMFPSFHTQTSLALILAAWPLRLLRYPILILNVVVILSTPVYGAHYLTDVLAGSTFSVAFHLGWRRLDSWIAMRRENLQHTDKSQ